MHAASSGRQLARAHAFPNTAPPAHSPSPRVREQTRGHSSRLRLDDLDRAPRIFLRHGKTARLRGSRALQELLLPVPGADRRSQSSPRKTSNFRLASRAHCQSAPSADAVDVVHPTVQRPLHPTAPRRAPLPSFSSRAQPLFQAPLKSVAHGGGNAAPRA